MKKNGGNIRYNEVELLRAGEVADTGVSDVGGFVSGDDIVPDAHLRARKCESGSAEATEEERFRQEEELN
ncbi:hypothetical protein E5676_scaffold10G00210 [Cucumis melo var. makuwa]|uniref:Uncharacterized protein n=1 Tax=Cucumis melo var. makuwa TaxID=1194695 RepID=A0A5A7UIE8_CUCMM|nr:hypothetical protein E6C27_scaffold318G001280 [Cucumis melo var. makuwa]TYJ96866.1 hypothetical protein E5676_scaffold10G00210 [Cucumis melo var. makuwa]